VVNEARRWTLIAASGIKFTFPSQLGDEAAHSRNLLIKDNLNKKILIKESQPNLKQGNAWGRV
jgi:hypothetical protein